MTTMTLATGLATAEVCADCHDHIVFLTRHTGLNTVTAHGLPTLPNRPATVTVHSLTPAGWSPDECDSCGANDPGARSLLTYA